MTHGTPDPVVDNIVFSSSAVPEPNVALILVATGLAASSRRRRRE